ncbi:MAG: phosphatase PAP2 family protein, partial [bacterium]
MLTLLFWVTNLDQELAQHFYTCTPSWPGRYWGWSNALYHWGVYPADLCAALGVTAFALSFASPKARTWRGPGLFLGLLLLAGPGLLSNLLAKNLAGRPRPSETLGFGGLWEFHRPFVLGIPGRGRSFLSGHASNAWYFLGLVFLTRRPWRGWVLAACLAFGLAMSLARVSQGAHWLSDVLLPGALLWTLAAGLSPLIHWQPSAQSVGRPAFLWALVGIALGLMSLSRVTYEERHFSGPVPAPNEGPTWRSLSAHAPPTAPKEVDVDVALKFGELDVDFDPAPETLAGPRAWPLTLDERFRGQGLLAAHETLDAEALSPGGQFQFGPGALAVRFTQHTRGLWLVADERARLGLPADLGLAARLRVENGTLRIGPFPVGRRILLTGLTVGVRPPEGFVPFGDEGWMRSGKAPLIALNDNAPN